MESKHGGSCWAIRVDCVPWPLHSTCTVCTCVCVCVHLRQVLCVLLLFLPLGIVRNQPYPGQPDSRRAKGWDRLFEGLTAQQVTKLSSPLSHETVQVWVRFPSLLSSGYSAFEHLIGVTVTWCTLCPDDFTSILLRCFLYSNNKTTNFGYTGDTDISFNST